MPASYYDGHGENGLAGMWRAGVMLDSRVELALGVVILNLVLLSAMSCANEERYRRVLKEPFSVSSGETCGR